MGLCETFLNNTTKNFVDIPGYFVTSTVRDKEQGGGLSIFLGKNVKFNKVVRDCITKTCEILLVEVLINHKTYLVGELYRRPNGHVKDFLREFEQILPIYPFNIYHLIFTHTTKFEQIEMSRYNNILIGCDHNLDYIKASQHVDTTSFLQLLNDNEIINTIQKPTRVTHKSATLIDNILVTSSNLSYDSYVITEIISDHYPCLTTLAVSSKYDKKIAYEVTRTVTDKKSCKLTKY